MHTKRVSRREFLRASVVFSGAALLPGSLFSEPALSDKPPAFTDQLPALRAKLGAEPIQFKKLGDNLTLLMGPGGNIAVLNGKDGKILVDTFVRPAWNRLKSTLDSIGPQPVNLVINTHWHFDHTDNNALFRAEWVPILAHKNTSIRMSETHNIDVLRFHFPPSSEIALPNRTFEKEYSLAANGETLKLKHVDPAHTDTDIFIFYENSNVVHCGDLVINNGGFPLIDYDSGGKIAGMVEASNRILTLADNNTRIIPGHGPIADKRTLELFRNLLVDVYERISHLRSQGRTLEETIAAKPLADLNAKWGGGLLNGDQYAEIAYRSL